MDLTLSSPSNITWYYFNLPWPPFQGEYTQNQKAFCKMVGINMHKLIIKHVSSLFGNNDATDSTSARRSGPRSRSFPFRWTSQPPATIPWKQGDSYKDIKELVHGSEARTSLTQSNSSGKVVVVKRFKTYARIVPRSASQTDSQPLPNEANLLLNILRPHPNVLEVFGCDLFGGLKANVYSEFCAGGDLLDQSLHFADLGLFAPEVFVLHVFVSLGNALAYLHHGLRWDPELKQYWSHPGHVSIIHGDIKCENTFLRWPGQCGLPYIVLGDFGQSQAANNFRGYAGTTGYQAPEIAALHDLKESDPRAHREVLRTTGHMTPAADIYSLGQTMHMICRQILHVVGADPYTMPARKVTDDDRRKSIGVDLSHHGRPIYRTLGLAQAIQWFLRPDPLTRPAARQGSMLEVVDGFRKALDKMLRDGEKIPGAMWASLPGEKFT